MQTMGGVQAQPSGSTTGRVARAAAAVLLIAAVFGSARLGWAVGYQAGFPIELTGQVPSAHGNWGTAVAVGDIDGDGDKEIVVATADEDNDAASEPDCFIYAFHHDGTPVAGWPKGYNNGGKGGMYGAHWLTLANVDADPALEIIAAGTGFDDVDVWQGNGTQSTLGTSVYGSAPCVADVDHNGDLEIVYTARVASNNLRVHDIGVNSLQWQWTAPTASPNVQHGLGVGDMDGDGDLEVVTTRTATNLSMGGIYAYHHNGTPYAPWVASLLAGGAESHCRITIGNVDGDPEAEVAYVAYTGNLYLLDNNGTLLWSKSGSRVGIQFVDVDRDGVNEIACGQYIYDGSGSTRYTLPQNPNGTHSPSFADFNWDGYPEAVYLEGSKTCRVYDLHSGVELWNFVPAVGDRTGSFHHWHSAVPLVADLDGDADLEVVYVTGSSVNSTTVNPRLIVLDDTYVKPGYVREDYRGWPQLYLNAVNNAVYGTEELPKFVAAGTVVLLR